MAKKPYVKDFGFAQEIIKFRKLAQENEVVIGVTGDKALEDVDADMRVVDIAAVHEFGTINGRVPERSFIRAGVDENISKIQKDVVTVTEMVADGRLTSEQALDAVGQRAVGYVRARIQKGIKPDLKPATKREKAKDGGTGKSTPLIRTGRLINSLTHVVREKGSTPDDARKKK